MKPVDPNQTTTLGKLKRYWFILELFTGLNATEGIEYAVMFPLVVTFVVGLPVYVAFRVVAAVVGA